MAMATTTTTSSNSTYSRCTNFFSPKGVRTAMRNTTAGCGKVDSVAMWFINGLASAFFASLERFSCIHIITQDETDDANDLPLISNDGNFQASTTRLRTTGKGKKTGGYAQDFMDDNDY